MRNLLPQHVDYYEYVQLCKKRYSEILDPICVKWKLTRNELDIIIFLANHPNNNCAADISARRGMSKSHVSKSVSNLVAKGFVRCVQDTEDHRIVRLELTEKISDICQEALSAQKSFFEKLMRGMTEEDIAFWHRLIEQIVQNMKDAIEMGNESE